MNSDNADSITRVRDIMTPDVVTLAASTKLEDAARSMSFHRVSGAPVLERGHIVGVISKTDLVDPKNRGAMSGTVADLMTRITHAVQPDDPAILAARLMVEQGIHRVVVVDDRGRLAGIVTAMDVMRAVVEGRSLRDGPPAHGSRDTDPDSAAYVDLTRVQVTE